jgi:hypothetical protein
LSQRFIFFPKEAQLLLYFIDYYWRRWARRLAAVLGGGGRSH